jgi:hypothetical protein
MILLKLNYYLNKKEGINYMGKTKKKLSTKKPTKPVKKMTEGGTR